MGKDDFSDRQGSEGQENRRQREEFASSQQESQEDGAAMERDSAHSNLGIGDEQNTVREKEEE